MKPVRQVVTPTNIYNPDFQHRSPVLWRLIVLACLLVSTTSEAILVDGRLDEPEWKNAQVIKQFVTVSPYSLSEPSYQTEVRMISSKDGIYIGFTNSQALATQFTEITARDAALTGDNNEVIIDFDSSNIAAYGFKVGNGGSIRDGIWRDENFFSSDWDGKWFAETTQDEEHWYSEIHIPWNVASMERANKTDRNQRDVKIYFSRTIRHLRETVANVHTYQDRQRFTSVFEKFSIKSFAEQSVQFFTSASVLQNKITDDSTTNVGADVFWKSSDGKQLSLTLNPDFGQVESDNLVVNFSPNETFFSERRPFFTQNEALFDVYGNENLRLIHTRRIGDAPDIGNELNSDIDAAIKFTGNTKLLNYGLFAVAEGDTELSQGRDYYAGRFLRTTDTYDVGFTSTHVSRPSLERTATVNAVDYRYRWNDALKLSGQYLHSNIEDDDFATGKSNDSAVWFQLEHQLSKSNNQIFSLSRYGDKFQVNDFGFLPRANLGRLAYSFTHKKPVYAEQSWAKNSDTTYQMFQNYDYSGERLITQAVAIGNWYSKNNQQLFLRAQVFSSGIDDRITRGNNKFNTDSGYSASVGYFLDSTGKYRNHFALRWLDKDVDGRGIVAHVHPSYQFNDRYSGDIAVFYTQTDDWVNWIADNDIGRYQRKLLTTSVNFNAVFTERQELRVKFQWVAFSAKARSGLTVLNNGETMETNRPEDFSLGNTALQIRYRYKIGPLSDLFLVASRGGNIFQAEEDSLFDLLSPSWSDPTSNNIFAKIRYQFR